MYSIQEVKNNLTGMGHGGTLNKVRNQYHLFERAGNTMLMKIDPLTTMRLAPLSQVVHDDVYNYTLPSDFKKIVDLIPEDNRTNLDDASRTYAGRFDLRKFIASKQLSIESNNGTKYIRINWKSRAGKTLNTLDSTTGNGTWGVVGSAANLVADTLYKVSGSASLRFDLVVSGDGLKNTTMAALDLSDWDEEADFFQWFYFPSAPTSVTAIWGNDVTTKYWTSVAQTTQADGSALQTGWNLLRFPWSSATETGTVDPTAIDSYKFTIAATGAISDIRADNIIVSLGRPFDLKYFSSYLFQNSSGTWLIQPSADTDNVVVDGLAYNIFLYECLLLMAQQMEAEESSFDVQFAQAQLIDLYKQYRREYPNQTKQAITAWTSPPRFRS